MIKNRRDFIRLTGKSGLAVAGSCIFPVMTAPQKTSVKSSVGNAVATLEDGRTVNTPFWRIESGREGPSLGLIASQHGNEVQGAEVARRFRDICAERLVSGSVWLLPFGNMLAVRSRRHSYDLEPEQNNRLNPDKFNNMQRTWPGNPKGNNTERLAYAIDQAVIKNCTHLVDIHCWEHNHAAETLSEKDHPGSSAMGQAAVNRFISYRNTMIPETGNMMVSQMVLKRGGNVLVMELSGQFQMREKQVQRGLKTMVNIAKLLKMINGEPEKDDGPVIERTAKNSHEVKAPCSGIFMPAPVKGSSGTLLPDDYVEKGQFIGHVINDKDLSAVPVTSPVSGYLWQYGVCHWNLCDASLPAQHPYTEEGEILSIIVNA